MEQGSSQQSGETQAQGEEVRGERTKQMLMKRWQGGWRSCICEEQQGACEQLHTSNSHSPTEVHLKNSIKEIY